VYYFNSPVIFKLPFWLVL